MRRGNADVTRRPAQDHYGDSQGLAAGPPHAPEQFLVERLHGAGLRHESRMALPLELIGGFPHVVDNDPLPATHRPGHQRMLPINRDTPAFGHHLPSNVAGASGQIEHACLFIQEIDVGVVQIKSFFG